jgi:hypothetical protein
MVIDVTLEYGNKLLEKFVTLFSILTANPFGIE